MNDVESVRQSVQQAREQATRDHLAEQKESAADTSMASREAASLLQKNLAGQLTEICMASSGAMHWASEPLSSGGTEFRLSWREPAPERTLSILVEEAGIVLWSWFADWLRPNYKRMNAAGFTSHF